MDSIQYTISSSSHDLIGILELQRANLPASLNDEDKVSQGFVTVTHSLEDLNKLNTMEKHVIAKADGKVIAYLLAMTSASSADIPILIPMFEVFNKTNFKGKPISEYDYIVVGQACVAKQYRGKGVLDHCYAAYKDHFSERYNFAITEIDCTNTRSLNAHKRIGFEEIVRYKSGDYTEWSIVIWDWRN